MKKVNSVCFALTSAIVFFGCSTSSSRAPDTATPGMLRVDLSAPVDNDWVEATLARLSLRQKVAQMAVPRISGAYMPIGSAEHQRLQDWVVRQGVGGVIITHGPPLEMAAKLNTLQEMADIPLIVTADMEHGPGQILQSGTILPYGIDNGGATRFPPLMGLGAAGDEQLAYDLGRITGVEARAAGVHLVFAPVVDVNNNPSNPIINTRSYGEDPAAVARLASAHIRGMQEHGVIATAKHFPGHGDTGTDSHINLPLITVSKARVDAVELPPYRAAIESGLGAVMSAHIAFPALTGDTVPATLSHRILTGVLRDELGFRGVIVSDAMDMGAIMTRYGIDSAAVMGVRAGQDMLLQPHPQNLVPMIDAVVAAVQRGEITEARIDESVRRILQAKARLGLHRQRTVDLARIPHVLGNPAHMERAEITADRSIAVARDRDRLLPLRSGQKLLSVVYADDFDPFTGRTFQRMIATSVAGTRALMLDGNADSAQIARVAAAVDSADVVMYSAYIRVTAHKGEVAIASQVADLIRQTAARKPTVVVSFGNPYVLTQFPDVGTYVLAWGQWDVSQRAAARALTGQIPVKGRLPIAIPPLHKIGDGIDINAQ